MTNELFVIDTSNGGGSFSVVGKIEDGKTDYIPSKGYIRDDGNIYIFTATTPDTSMVRYSNVPRFWFEDGRLRYLEDRTPGKIYNTGSDAFHECSIPKIDEMTPEGIQLYNEAEVADMYASQTVFVPVIEECDDPMKAMIKETIIRKHVDINSYKSRVTKKYTITNLRSGLTGKTKMTITNWQLWSDLMNFKYKIIIEDAGPTPLPIGGKIIYDSTTNTRTFIPDNPNEADVELDHTLRTNRFCDDDEEDYEDD